MNGTCIVSFGASLAFAYCSFCSDNVSSDSLHDYGGCIVLDRKEIVVGNDDTCECNVSIYLKDNVVFDSLFIALIKDESNHQSYVDINGEAVLPYRKGDITFSNVNYNGFNKCYSHKFTFKYKAPSNMDYFDFCIVLCIKNSEKQAFLGDPFLVRIRRQNNSNTISVSDVVNDEVVDDKANKKSISTEDNNIQQLNLDTLDAEVKSNNSNLCMDRIETNVTTNKNNYVTNNDVKIDDPNYHMNVIENNITTNENNYVTNNDIKIDDPNSHMNVIENNVVTNEVIVDSDKENANNDYKINNSILTNENETERNINKGEEVMMGFDINGQEKLNKSIINFESDEKDGTDALMDNKCIGNNLIDNEIDDSKLVNDFVGRNLSKKELIDEDRDVMFPRINKSRVDMATTNDKKNNIDVSKVCLSRLYGLENVKVVSNRGSGNVRTASTTGLNYKKHGSVNKEDGKDTVVNSAADKSGKGCCRGCRAR